MSIVSIARPEIQALRAYDAAEQVDASIRLNANESPQLNTVGDFRRPLNRYPEVRPQQLQAAMADSFGCRAEQLLVTRGSSEAIDLLIRSFCRAGYDNMLTPSPSFSMYRHYAELQGAGVIEVPMAADHDFAIDVDELLVACDDSTKLIFVCSPNNPTGTALPRRDLLRLLQKTNDRSAVVVDEAYVEFGDDQSVVELLDEYPNLIILRTMSKALGFAGARCGAVVAAMDVIAMLSAVQAPYALATPVVECVENAFAAQQLAMAAKNVEQVIVERQRLMTAMADFKFVQKIWPSQANFFLVRVEDAECLIRHCNANKVLLRHFGGDLSDCIRISVGNPSDSDFLLSILRLYAEAQPCP